MTVVLNSAQLTLFSTPALQKALESGILRAYSTETGIRIDTTFEPTAVLLKRIEAGACPDVLIGVTQHLDGDAPADAMDLATRVPIAKAGLGMAIHPNQKMPDISTMRALTETLTNARSIAYSRSGISSVIFLELLNDLGIADQLMAKATIVDSGFTALAVLDGRAEVAVQLVSELLCVDEAKLVGQFPQGAQRYSEFSAVIGAHLADRTDAISLINFLNSDYAHNRYVAAGLTLPD